MKVLPRTLQRTLPHNLSRTVPCVVPRLCAHMSTNGADSSSIPSSADWLVGLNHPSGETSNEEAQRWIEAMRKLREKWTPDGKEFNVDHAFAPEGMDDDFDFWAAADAEIAVRKRMAANAITGSAPANSSLLDGITAEQIAEAEAVQNEPIPPKYDMWMNMLVNQVMRHGEKAKAYKTVNRALYLAYLKLREDPVALLMAALDKMAPLAQLHRIGDGGARVEVFPVPYSATKRIGLAWKWVLEASQRRQSRDFAVRLSEEIVAAIEGRSPGFEKGAAIHKAAVANRSVAEEVQQGRWKR